MSEALHDAWTRYLETVRWFGGKGAGARVTQLIPLPSYTPLSASPAVRSEIAEVSYPDGRVEHYHLLVAHYPDGAQTRPSGVVVGTDEVGGSIVQVVDAITDAAALATFVAATEPAFADRAVQVWRGEQSNTTLTLGDTDLYKLFRKVEPGPNLETEILLALDGDNVPELRGRLLAPWPDGVSTDLGMVVERIPGARDGWQLATAACAAERDFSEE
ncbi:MAG: maltokinase N-terminal cap-like domain-containing protein, partial [Actinomycetes bacterium]